MMDSSDPAPVIALELSPQKLSFTLIRASISYRLTLRNIGEMPIIGLRIHSDLITAHASKPDDEQLSGPDMSQAETQKIARLDPEQSAILSGNQALILADAQIIHYGTRKMLLPLMRFRLIGAGTPPLIRAFVIGHSAPDGEKLRPFRLDSGAAQHDDIAAHALG